MSRTNLEQKIDRKKSRGPESEAFCRKKFLQIFLNFSVKIFPSNYFIRLTSARVLSSNLSHLQCFCRYLYASGRWGLGTQRVKWAWGGATRHDDASVSE